MNPFQKFASLNENDRALLAIDLLVDLETPPEDLRAAWEFTYQHRSEIIIMIIKHQFHETLVERTLMRWLQRAAFEICIEGETVTLYRGEPCRTEHSPFGLSWTTDKEVAAFFAVRSDDASNPIVYRTEIPVSKILWHSDGRLEKEVIFDLNWFRENGTVEKFGSQDEWNDWCRAYQNRDNDLKDLLSK